MNRKAVRIILGLSLLIVIAAGGLYIYFYSAQHRIEDFNARLVALYSKDHVPSKKEQSELLISLNRVLASPVYGYHDAYMLAGDIGNEETLRLLKLDVKHHEAKWRDRDTIECTYGHLFDSIKTLESKYPDTAQASP